MTVGPVTPTALHAASLPDIVESPVYVILREITRKHVEFAFPLNVTFVAGVYITPVKDVVPFAVMELSPVSPPPLLLVSASAGS